MMEFWVPVVGPHRAAPSSPADDSSVRSELGWPGASSRDAQPSEGEARAIADFISDDAGWSAPAGERGRAHQRDPQHSPVLDLLSGAAHSMRTRSRRPYSPNIPESWRVAHPASLAGEVDPGRIYALESALAQQAQEVSVLRAELILSRERELRSQEEASRAVQQLQARHEEDLANQETILRAEAHASLEAATLELENAAAERTLLWSRLRNVASFSDDSVERGDVYDEDYSSLRKDHGLSPLASPARQVIVGFSVHRRGIRA